MEDDVAIDLFCAKCGHVEKREVRWVQENNFFTCPSCSATVLIDKDAAMKLLVEKDHAAG